MIPFSLPVFILRQCLLACVKEEKEEETTEGTTTAIESTPMTDQEAPTNETKTKSKSTETTATGVNRGVQADGTHGTMDMATQTEPGYWEPLPPILQPSMRYNLLFNILPQIDARSVLTLSRTCNYFYEMIRFAKNLKFPIFQHVLVHKESEEETKYEYLEMEGFMNNKPSFDEFDDYTFYDSILDEHYTTDHREAIYRKIRCDATVESVRLSLNTIDDDQFNEIMDYLNTIGMKNVKKLIFGEEVRNVTCWQKITDFCKAYVTEEVKFVVNWIIAPNFFLESVLQQPIRELNYYEMNRVIPIDSIANSRIPIIIGGVIGGQDDLSAILQKIISDPTLEYMLLYLNTPLKSNPFFTTTERLPFDSNEPLPDARPLIFDATGGFKVWDYVILRQDGKLVAIETEGGGIFDAKIEEVGPECHFVPPALKE